LMKLATKSMSGAFVNVLMRCGYVGTVTRLMTTGMKLNVNLNESSGHLRTNKMLVYRLQEQAYASEEEQQENNEEGTFKDPFRCPEEEEAVLVKAPSSC